VTNDLVGYQIICLLCLLWAYPVVWEAFQWVILVLKDQIFVHSKRLDKTSCLLDTKVQSEIVFWWKTERFFPYFICDQCYGFGLGLSSFGRIDLLRIQVWGVSLTFFFGVIQARPSRVAGALGTPEISHRSRAFEFLGLLLLREINLRDLDRRDNLFSSFLILHFIISFLRDWLNYWKFKLEIR